MHSTEPYDYCNNYYNTIAKSYNKLHRQEQLKKANLILNYIKPKPADLLLDIGAGTGISTKPFAKFCKCIALEQSKNLLKQCKHKNIKTIPGKAESLPFKNNSFDIIISVTALHHANLKKALSEIQRVAKPNAKIAISFLKKSKKLREIKKLLKNWKQIDAGNDVIFVN